MPFRDFLCAANSRFEKNNPEHRAYGWVTRPRLVVTQGHITHDDLRAIAESGAKSMGGNTAFTNSRMLVGSVIGNALEVATDVFAEAFENYYSGPVEPGSVNYDLPLGVYLILGDMLEPGRFLFNLGPRLPAYLHDENNIDLILSKIQWRPDPISLSTWIAIDDKGGEVDDVTGAIVGAFVSNGYINKRQLKAISDGAAARGYPVLKIALQMFPGLKTHGVDFGRALFDWEGRSRVSEPTLREILKWLR